MLFSYFLFVGLFLLFCEFCDILDRYPNPFWGILRVCNECGGEGGEGLPPESFLGLAFSRTTYVPCRNKAQYMAVFREPNKTQLNCIFFFFTQIEAIWLCLNHSLIFDWSPWLAQSGLLPTAVAGSRVRRSYNKHCSWPLEPGTIGRRISPKHNRDTKQTKITNSH